MSDVKFTGWTNPDGSRKVAAPPGWPFGTVKPQELARQARQEAQDARQGLGEAPL